MGMYTEIYVNIDLEDNTPDDVMKVIEAAVEGVDEIPGKPGRWAFMFHSTSYLPHTHCAVLNKCQYIGASLLGKGAIKNYGGEIEQFFQFIAPWSRTEFMGYMRYEEDEKPTLVYKSELIKE